MFVDPIDWRNPAYPWGHGRGGPSCPSISFIIYCPCLSDIPPNGSCGNTMTGYTTGTGNRLTGDGTYTCPLCRNNGAV